MTVVKWENEIKQSLGGILSSANVHIDINVLASGYNGFYDVTMSLNLLSNLSK